MQSIIQWAVSLTVVCAVGALILFLSPQSSVSKSVKTVVALCVFTIFLTPILNIVIPLKNYDYSSYIDRSQEDISEQMIKYACLEAEELCEDLITRSGAHAEKIEANANIDENNSIYITNIKIYMSQEYYDRREEINKKIRNVFEIDGEYIWEKK